MKILALDSSTNICSLCIRDDGRVLGEYISHSTRTHTERILPALDLLFHHLDFGIQQMEGLAVITGPGSFTGLRIGISVIKGLAASLNLKVVTANALSVAAAQVKEKGFICPAMDARRGEIFTALYERTEQGILRSIIEPKSIRPEIWMSELPDAPVMFCGPGGVLYKDVLLLNSNSTILFEDFHLARTLSEMAEIQFSRTEAVAGEEVHAAYLRPSDAEAKGPRPRKIIQHFTR